jgi:anaphase-promoting complex subunit 8
VLYLPLCRDVKSTYDLADILDDDEPEQYLMAKSYFDLKEYDRCAFFTKVSKTPRVIFLHYYSKYLAGEKKRLDNQTDTIASVDSTQLAYLRQLRAELQKMYNQAESDEDAEDIMDGYMLYLYGVVLKRLGLNDMAKDILVEAIEKEPCHWGAWLELSFHISDRSALQALDLPDHWLKSVFLAHCYLELLLNDQALEIYFALQNGGLKDSTYIMAQVAIAFHNKRELDQAVEAFKQLTETDPHRLDNLDTYSNVLYVKDQRVDLAHLAHKTVQIDKYRPETCCVIGNYYSLRSQHGKAVLYFQRALRLNPNYLSAWTLMGHEFMELKNKSAAIQSYRHAIEVNPRDYRAWYGLGQTYEILKMHSYCLYYYKKAQELRPNDSRMLMALGESYEKLDKLQDALKCYWKAHCLGDIERSIALFHLAKLYERTGDSEQAAAAYSQFIVDAEAEGMSDDRDQLSRAYRYLAQFHVKRGQLEDAYRYAQKCTEFADTREEGKALLKEITSKRVTDQSQSEATMMSGAAASPRNHAALDRILRETNSSFTSPHADNATSHSPLEPMNLTFTP